VTGGTLDFPLPPDLDRWAFGFMLVLARVAGAMTLLPGLGESAPPAMLRAGLALCVTLLLLPGLLPALPHPPEASLQAALMLAAEVVTGVWFGWLTRLLVLALPMGAQFIAYTIGISSVLQPDADLGPQTTAVARLFEAAAPLLILVSGLYTLPLAALEGLYRLIPAGTLLPAEDGTQTVLRIVAETFTLALRLASPFVLASLVWHVATGLMARFLPRLQVYFVAVPGQILGGLLLLASLSGALVAAWLDTMRGSLAALPGSG
jgi:flagellar biosynthetic protein FliR